MNRKPETAMAVLAEIHEISERLEARPGNLKDLVRIASLYLEDSKPTRSRPYLDQAVKIFQASPKQQAYQEADDLANLLIKFWKAEKHTVTPKGELRLNLTPERESLLGELERAMLVAMRLRQPEFAHSTALKMAYVREALGEFQASLALLSELISEQVCIMRWTVWI
ncbi:hypothetical protein B484DRAFT_394812 [Ochromonadaceae sp. CCMP2298]|nr:hypothetical protein B484DRAFT_394812 [Ochromonadaceae sp. CCMP2298]